MGRVSVILPLNSADQLNADAVSAIRRPLEDGGFLISVYAVLGPDIPLPADPRDGEWTWHSAFHDGLSAATIAGLAQSDTEYQIVLDIARGYDPDDLPLLVEALRDSKADLVVASTPGEQSPFHKLSKAVLSVSDPLSGLIAITEPLARMAIGSFDPVGDRFAIDFLARTRGRRLDMPVRRSMPGKAVPLSIDDLRHLKRLADDRFGNASRLIQFCAVGASGMMVDLSCYALFQLLFKRSFLAGMKAPIVGSSLDLAVAGALAIGFALTWNFSLNRRLTFNYARQGSIVVQYLTYAMSNALGIALSFWLRLYLPAHFDFFNKHRLAAAVVGIVAATGISFSMARWVVFSRRPSTRVKTRMARSVKTYSTH